MALDIREGDILTLGGVEYPILFCGVWKSRRGSTPAQVRMCSETAGTKRPPSGVVRGNPVANLSDLKCMPLDPASSMDIELRTLPTAPRVIKRTIVDGGDTFYEVFVEHLKKAA